ncbi:MAG: hypothetical protein U9O55_02930 [Patescibacteria group bacterium]|nr:hypothetical protein [Patescibacteria group bacterium]
MFKKIKFIILSLFIICCLFNFTTAEAITVGGLENTGSQAGFNTGVTEVSSVSGAIGEIIGIFLSFLGIIFFVLMVYGGFIWMTAGGSQDKVGQAKKIIANAILGLIIVFSAYIITYIITSELSATVGESEISAP